MHKYKIELVTYSDVLEFIKIVKDIEGEIKLIDGNDFCVNGKSLLGALATIEWSSLYCLSENAIYTEIQKFCTGGN